MYFYIFQQEESILKAADQLCQVFGRNAFPLHEIASNSKSANSVFHSWGISPENPILKTLGLWWKNNLLAKNSHIIFVHMGLKATIRNLYNKYWVTKYTQIIKQVIKDCKVCFEQRGKRYHVPGSHKLPILGSTYRTPFP